jgi:hypothetical protein
MSLISKDERSTIRLWAYQLYNHYICIFFNCVETMDRITCGLIVVRISLVLSMLITTKVVRLNPSHGEVYSIKHFVIKLVSGLRPVGGSFRVPLFPPHPPPLFSMPFRWKYKTPFHSYPKIYTLEQSSNHNITISKTD